MASLDSGINDEADEQGNEKIRKERRYVPFMRTPPVARIIFFSNT